MYAKALLIPIAALALSATSAYAFDTSLLEKAGLSQSQISAFESARELKEEGKIQDAQQVLIEAHIDLRALESVRTAAVLHKQEQQKAIEHAIRTDDYEGFKKAIEGLPLSDIVITQHDFKLFRDAYVVDVPKLVWLHTYCGFTCAGKLTIILT
jgi:uncharacterized protein YbaP (TraB family)